MERKKGIEGKIKDRKKNEKEVRKKGKVRKKKEERI